ncbi:putative uncharacterized protein C8orf44 [Plecturocebus cupreus]
MSRTWWCVPVVPATREAEAGELLETGKTEVAAWPVILAVWETEVGRSPEVRSSRPAWPTWQNPISTINTKISWRWQAPIIPATREAEEGEWLEPGGRGCKQALSDTKEPPSTLKAGKGQK